MVAGAGEEIGGGEFGVVHDENGDVLTVGRDEVLFAAGLGAFTAAIAFGEVDDHDPAAAGDALATGWVGGLGHGSACGSVNYAPVYGEGGGGGGGRGSGHPRHVGHGLGDSRPCGGGTGDQQPLTQEISSVDGQIGTPESIQD